MNGFVFGNLGMTELLVILVIVLLLFGARRLPELAKGLGQSIRAFKHGIAESQVALEDQHDMRGAQATKKMEKIETSS